MKLINNFLVFTVITLLSCNSKPKVIVEDAAPSSSEQTATAPAGTSSAAATPSGDMHEVTAVEVLQAERYTYLKVKEKGEPYWIATSKFEAKVGGAYLYRGGLLKTDFESVEHKRVFDKIFLVGEIIDAAAHPGSSGGITTVTPDIPSDFKESKNVAGAVKLSDIFGNKEKFSGKSILVAGKCVKANYGIMGKNWFHIQDGSKVNGKVCDFTITSLDNIPLGANVAFQGKVVLNKDFGAGYVYDIIMEDGKFK